MSSIDREALVKRHNPLMTAWQPESPLSLGNGDFAYTADITGMQTFGDNPEGCIPRCTMSQWGFHSYPDAPESDGDLRLKEYACGERTVGYMTDDRGQEKLYHGLRLNPHRFHLGKAGLFIDAAEEEPSGPLSERLLDSRMKETEQTLDMWTGKLTSTFRLDGLPVKVESLCHPSLDLLSFRLESPLLKEGKIGLDLRFPYPSHEKEGADWSKQSAHTSVLEVRTPFDYVVNRELDSFRYEVHVCFSGESAVSVEERGEHRWVFTSEGDVLEFSLLFREAGSSPADLPLYGETEEASRKHWNAFWQEGAAVSFEGSTDRRAMELERRVVLSQYLLALQSLGSLPPAETGLTCNSWYGKFHLEMHIWHALHGLLWNRADLVERSLGWYGEILPSARRRAEKQGYAGVRWPKMTDKTGRDSPSPIGTLLCWQQPHIILFAELLYRKVPEKRILSSYAERVFQTAEFMADYPLWDEEKKRYILGPPLIPAQENHAPEETVNPVFELEYWRWGLKTALEWKKRLAEEAPGKWEEVLTRLSTCPVDPQGKKYLAHENCPDTYGRYATDHPSMLMAFGLLPPQSIAPSLMSNSFDAVRESWQFPTMWGWDFPTMAMTLARLGRRKDAVDMLLLDSDKNTYVLNGHNRQVGSDDLPLYLPGNGGLLIAVAMMAAGWDGSSGDAPGFPDDGSWKVQSEGMATYL